MKQHYFLHPGFSLFLILILSLFIRCNGSKSKKKKETTITISGAFALYPLATRWATEFQQKHPDIKIDITAGGAGKGIMDCLSGMADLGMVSRQITEDEKLKGAWFIAVAKDAVVPTINSHCPVLNEIKKYGLTKQQFTDIYITEKIHSWHQIFPSKQPVRINTYTRSDACGAAQVWGEYLANGQEDLNGTAVFGDPSIASAIKNDKLGTGFNNIIYVYDIHSRKVYEGMEVIPIDLNENRIIDSTENFYSTLDQLMEAVRSGRYPSPPARDLYFVSKGPPSNPSAVLFMEWILTEGQQYVMEAGYVRLKEDIINAYLQKLKP